MKVGSCSTKRKTLSLYKFDKVSHTDFTVSQSSNFGKIPRITGLLRRGWRLTSVLAVLGVGRDGRLAELGLELFILGDSEWKIDKNDLDASESSASLFMFGIAAAYAFILYLGYRSEEKLGNLLVKIVKLINYVARLFLKRDYLSEDRARDFALEVAEGFSGLNEKPSSLVRPIL